MKNFSLSLSLSFHFAFKKLSMTCSRGVMSLKVVYIFTTVNMGGK
jgi:hypothetical protein